MEKPERHGNNLRVLEELTKKLPSFPETIEGRLSAGSWQEYRMIKGKSKARSLLTVPGKVSVAEWWNSVDSEFPEHSHEEREFLLVYEGEMRLFVEGKEYVLKEGDSRYVAPGMRHNAYFPVHTNYIASTVPDNEDWPT
jgi:quercetin dioxygenase-like cupin family protein